MDVLVCKRYVVVFLLALSQNFVTIIASNITHETQILSKAFTQFLKVPWINLNSSWIDTAASTCQDDIVTLYKSADAGEMWALKMLDAASKVPAGILTGNIWDLGMFDECVEVKSNENPAHIQGQHCMVSLSIPTKFFEAASRMMQIQKLVLFNPSADVDLSLSMSVCVPSSCGIQDINNLVNASIQAMPELGAFGVDVAKVACSSFEPSIELTLGTILVISFYVMITIILLICTACDFVLRSRPDNETVALRNAARFSLYTNAVKILSIKQTAGTMSAIHGIRFLSTCLIITVHRFFCMIIEPKVNIADAPKFVQSVTSTFLLMLPFVVDTFFVMSGFFMAFAFLKALRLKTKINIFRLYIHRYFRLTPCIAVVLLFTIFIIPHLGSGPIWKYVSDATIGACQKNWWTNVLHIQNIVNVEQICLLHTWYVAVEMQLFLLSPIFLFPLFYRPKIGLVLLGLVLVVSFCAPAIQLVVNGWSVLFDLNKSTLEIFTENMKSLPLTCNRALPYFIGISMGYDLSNKRRQLSMMQVTFNWILAILFVISCGWIVHHIQPNWEAYNPVWEAIYVSVGRLIWSLAMAWVVYACTQGYGGLVTKFLSLPIFVPLSRLSYSIYLVHYVLQMATTATMRTARYRTAFNVMYLIGGDLALTIGISFILSLCIESPIIALEKCLMSSPSPASAKHDSTPKHAKFLVEVERYLDLNTDRVDFVIESVTSRSDFWQTISNGLNTLSEGPPKTPTEWSKTWHDWRSRSLEANSLWAARNQSKGVPIKDSQPQSGVAALEKELMIFLAVTDCGLTAERNVEEADIIESKSHTNIRDQQREDQHEDPIRLAILDANVFDNEKSKFSGSESADVE